MHPDWSPLDAELAIWRARDLHLPIWWRDDDAVAATPQLEAMITVAERLGIPVHLAVIPKHAERSLVTLCRSTPLLVPLVHGWSHVNYATGGRKKAEFGEARSGLIQDAARALAQMRQTFGADFIEVFVPPWNRIDASLIAELPGLGYAALSAFTPRPRRQAAPGLVQINTHVDPIDWRGGGGLSDPDRLVAALTAHLRDRRAGDADAGEPLGFLTHHLVQSPRTWAFARDCMRRLLDAGAEVFDMRRHWGALP